MDRRTALKVVGCSLALSSMKGRATAGEKVLPWKIGLGLNGFASASKKYNKIFPIWEVLDFASRTGFDGIELFGGWPMGDYPKSDEKGRIAALKRLYDAFGLRIFSIQTSAGGAFAPDAVVRRRWLERMRDQCRFAKAVGCECIGMWPGGPLRGQTIDEAIDRLAASFHEVGKIAGDLGLIAAFEIEPPFVFNTEEHLRRILEKANHPSLKTIFDSSHFDLMNGSTGRPHEMLRRIGVENIGYVHLTDTDGTLRDGGTPKHLACGDGHIDIEAALATLAEGGFRGWINIDTWQIPDPYDAARKGYRVVQQARQNLAKR